MGYICVLDSNRECQCCHQCDPTPGYGSIVCDMCNKEINEDYYYEIEGMKLCEDCTNSEYRKFIEE